LQITMGKVLPALKGYGGREPEYAWLRAEELCNRLDDTDAAFTVEIGLNAVYAIRGDFERSEAQAGRIMTLAADSPEKLLAAHDSLGRHLFYRGKLDASEMHLEQVLAHFASNPERDLSFYYSEARIYLAWGLWYRGYPQQALEKLGNAVAAARQIGNAEFLAGALGHAARFHILRREAETVLKLAEEAYALAIERGFPSWMGEGAMIRGWALIELGRESEGLEQLRKGIETEIAVLDTAWYLGGWPAEAFGKASQIDEALGYLAKTFKPGHESYVFESDLHRLRGEMLLKKDSSQETEAEDYFKTAIEVARGQGLKSPELNATASLARLLAQQGKRDEARAILAETYGWFTEGFDSADLKDAKALLDQISG